MGRKLLIRCSCGWNEHMAFLTYWDEPEMYFQFHLVSGYWWQRLWIAIRYVLGYKSQFGAWDEIVIDRKAVQEMASFLDDFLADTPEE